MKTSKAMWGQPPSAVRHAKHARFWTAARLAVLGGIAEAAVPTQSFVSNFVSPAQVTSLSF